MTKRLFAAVLCLCLILALLPANALADLEEGDATELQAAINGAYSAGLLQLDRTYNGEGAVFSVSITSPLTLDLNGKRINDITLHIGDATAVPAVTIKDSSSDGDGWVNCSGAVSNAINIDNGSLTVESGAIIGAVANGNAIVINSGSVTIRGGAIRGHTGINYLGGSLTFDCTVAGKTATITSVGVNNPLSLANKNSKSVTVTGDTRVKINDVVTTADDLKSDVAGAITLDKRPAAPSITAPDPLVVKMSDTPAYSGEFILAGDPKPIVEHVNFEFMGYELHDLRSFD